MSAASARILVPGGCSAKASVLEEVISKLACCVDVAVSQQRDGAVKPLTGNKRLADGSLVSDATLTPEELVQKCFGGLIVTETQRHVFGEYVHEKPSAMTGATDIQEQVWQWLIKLGVAGQPDSLITRKKLETLNCGYAVQVFFPYATAEMQLLQAKVWVAIFIYDDLLERTHGDAKGQAMRQQLLDCFLEAQTGSLDKMHKAHAQLSRPETPAALRLTLPTYDVFLELIQNYMEPFASQCHQSLNESLIGSPLNGSLTEVKPGMSHGLVHTSSLDSNCSSSSFMDALNEALEEGDCDEDSTNDASLDDSSSSPHPSSPSSNSSSPLHLSSPCVTTPSRRVMSAEWTQRYLQSYVDYLEGVQKEWSWTGQGANPTMRQYLDARYGTICLYTYTLMVELCSGRELPAASAQSPEHFQVACVANYLVLVQNDLLGYPKDVAMGEGVQFGVLADMRSKLDGSLDKAIGAMRAVQRDLNSELEAALKVLVDADADRDGEDTGVEWFADRMQLLMVGLLDAQLNMRRYAGAQDVAFCN